MSSPDVKNNLRIATFSIAAFDYLQTLPGEYYLYKKQWKSGRISVVCVLFIVVRYVSIMALVLNGIGFYSHSFNEASCKVFFYFPMFTKMIAGMASNGIIFARTYAISRTRRTFIFLWIVWILVLPLQILGNTYQRVPVIGTGSEAGNCQAKTPAGEFMSAPLYYLANLIFDAAASGIATVSLLRRGSASGKLGHFGKKVLKHGLLYAFASTFTNFMVTFALFDTKGLKVLGSFLSIGVTMILAQHLVLATAGIKTSTSGHCSSEDEFPDTSRHRSVSRDVKHRRVTTIGGTIVNVSSSCQGQARHMNADVTSPQLGSKFEPELGGIWVQTDTEIYQMAEDGDDIELKSPQHKL